MDLSPQIRFLSYALMESREYKELKKAKSHYLKNKEFSEKVDQLKTLQYEIYKAKLGTKRIDYRKMNEIIQRIEEISKVSEIEQYLMKEINFHNLVNRAFNKVSEIIDSKLR